MTNIISFFTNDNDSDLRAESAERIKLPAQNKKKRSTVRHMVSWCTYRSKNGVLLFCCNKMRRVAYMHCNRTRSGFIWCGRSGLSLLSSVVTSWHFFPLYVFFLNSGSEIFLRAALSALIHIEMSKKIHSACIEKKLYLFSAQRNFFPSQWIMQLKRNDVIENCVYLIYPRENFSKKMNF